ncbi:unnamed protein product [Rotaria sp. Silwood2]|nr:unnamed protein product [Rotaria sp. Silwood2]
MKRIMRMTIHYLYSLYDSTIGYNPYPSSPVTTVTRNSSLLVPQSPRSNISTTRDITFKYSPVEPKPIYTSIMSFTNTKNPSKHCSSSLYVLSGPIYIDCTTDRLKKTFSVGPHCKRKPITFL